VVTGGMDGDEYTGIQSAYQLIDLYKDNDFPGRLIILPLVNIPGFFAGKSLNPIDNKYPKHVFPGNSKGSSTQMLMAWIFKKYLSNADLWLDLHSGAMTESLKPFIWAYKTQSPVVNKIVESVLASVSCPVKIYKKSPSLSKADQLSKRNCGYILFESGEKGEQNSEDIKRMVTWVKQTLEVVWNPKVKKKPFKYFQEVTEYTAKKQGLWEPVSTGNKVSKGQIIGTVKSLDGKKLQEVKIKQPGMVLWAKSALLVNIGDELIAVASY
jgi:uncharacterized protein